MHRIPARTLLAALLLAAGAAAEPIDHLHLILNVGDAGDRYVADAGRTLGEALDGARPATIEPGADRYFVLLEPGATERALEGAARRKGAATVAGGAAEGRAAGAAEGPAAGAASPARGESGWVEWEAPVATLFLWSEIGEGESEWRRESPRLFVRRLAEDKVVVLVGEKGIEAPAP